MKYIKTINENAGSINEARATAESLLKAVVKGDSSEVEGIKLSKEMADAFLMWLKGSTYGKKFGGLPFYKLFTASFNWGLSRYTTSKELKKEYKELNVKAKEMSKAEMNKESVNETTLNEYSDISMKVSDMIKAFEPWEIADMFYMNDEEATADEILAVWNKNKSKKAIISTENTEEGGQQFIHTFSLGKDEFRTDTAVPWEEWEGMKFKVLENMLNEAKFVSSYDTKVNDAETKKDVSKIYPKAEFFIGKHTHFFGELEPNLFFKAYYADVYKEDTGKSIKGDFKITSVYSKKGSKYVELLKESEVNEAAPKMKQNKDAEYLQELMNQVANAQKGGMASRYGKDFDKAKTKALRAIKDMVMYSKIGI
tara:strand:+ start:69 stop:1172 length:1104 start_codon:yes stop_codon:yes gene_type:complete